VDSLQRLLLVAKADTAIMQRLIDIGNFYEDEGELDSVNFYLSQALSISKELNDEEGTALLNYKLGNACAEKGFYQTALQHYFAALPYYEKNGKHRRMGMIYNSMQNVYLEMDKINDAIAMGEKALEFTKGTPSEKFTLLNMAITTIYAAPRRYDKAEAYYKALFDLLKTDPNEYIEGLGYLNMGDMYLQREHWTKSKANFQKALPIFTRLEADDAICTAKIGLGLIALREKNYREAEKLAAEALEIARRNKILLTERRALSLIKDLALVNGDLAVVQRLDAACDSIDKVMTNDAVLLVTEELNIKYETEKKEMQITTLQEEKRLMVWLSVAGGAVLLLALAAFFFLWRWTMQKQRLAEKQKELAEQQVKQLEQEKQLIATQAVLDGEVQERIRLARDLHDSLGSILAAAKYNLLGIKQISLLGKDEQECYGKTVSLLDDSMNEMRRVAHHLMPDALSRFGLKPAISDFCDTLPSIQFVWYGDESRFDAKLEEVVYRIIHELISNALKHSGASHIFVQVIQEPRRIAFTVQDDGNGFDPETAAAGMGLSNIRTRVASFGGIMNINSKAGEGTETNIEFPLKVENVHNAQ
jgi:signal transduction histidine kinase